MIDYGKKKVEKCIIEGKKVDTDFEKMNEYYKQVYPKLIMQLEREALITLKENGA